MQSSVLDNNPAVLDFRKWKSAQNAAANIVAKAVEWIEEELCFHPPAQTLNSADYHRAAKLGDKIFAEFGEQFQFQFSDRVSTSDSEIQRIVQPRAVPRIRSTLLRWLGQARPQYVDAALEHIRDRQVYLLNKFKEKYQASLFGRKVVDFNKIEGYLKRVIDIECRKLDLDQLARTIRYRHVIHNFVEATEETQSSRLNSAVDSETLMRLVVLWNSRQHGVKFKFHEQLEGLVALGLAEFIANREIRDELLKVLTTDRAKWQEKLDYLRSRASSLLWRRHRKQAQLDRHQVMTAKHTEARASLDRLEASAIRVEQRLAEHWGRFLPRASEVEQVLSCRPEISNTRNSRFRRIGHEIQILLRRVTSKIDADETGAPASAMSFVQRLQRNIEHRPVGKTQKSRMTEEELGRRNRAKTAWENEAHAVLVEAYELKVAAADTLAHSTADRRRWNDFLSDTIFLYRFGLLDRVGIAQSLRFLSASEIHQITRVDSANEADS